MSAYHDALGEALPASLEQRFRGVKWIYWRHDLQAALVRARRGELSAGDWLRSVSGPKIEAVFARRDPVPFVADVVNTSGAVIAAAHRRLAAGVLGRIRSRPAVTAQAAVDAGRDAAHRTP
jgi:predicted ATP-grasp superfamily ATP-dependent carboligase